MNREYVLEHMEPVSKKEIRGKVVEEKRGLSHDEKRIIKDSVLSEDGHIHRYNESVRMYSREELRSLVENSGLTITHEFGDYTGELFSDKSPRLILAARKQAE